MLALMGTVWLQPQLLSIAGIGIAIAWVYGVLFARLARTCLQYAILHWGVNRYGVMVLGVCALIGGIVLVYYGWRESVYLWMGIGWVMVYAGYDVAQAAYKKRLGHVVWELMTTLQYLLVALMALALFRTYISGSPVGQLEIEYQGLAGESLLFIAMIMTGCEIVHQVAMGVWDRVEKLIN